MIFSLQTVTLCTSAAPSRGHQHYFKKLTKPQKSCEIRTVFTLLQAETKARILNLFPIVLQHIHAPTHPPSERGCYIYCFQVFLTTGNFPKSQMTFWTSERGT